MGVPRFCLGGEGAKLELRLESGDGKNNILE